MKVHVHADTGHDGHKLHIYVPHISIFRGGYDAYCNCDLQ